MSPDISALFFMNQVALSNNLYFVPEKPIKELELC